MKTVKVSITLPADLVKEMKTLSPNLSSFIAKGMSDYVARERRKNALRASAGAWKAEGHPGLEDLSQIEQYVEEIRSGWRHEG
ncbi:MAG TPA: type II toxin-antitoxin system CcdA family antitoxin [Clostridia bacterium]|nr:type II toxin-antitoxin system CcdA family antitoxin [Clostridia bacterium]